MAPETHSFFLFGARGVGKSTFLRQKYLETSFLSINLLKESEYYSLSQRPDSLLERLESAPANSLTIIDEVQRVPALLNLVHFLIEERKLRFILSGSSSRKLKRGNANLLAGRALYYEMFPFTHRELGNRFDLASALNWGTLPGLLDFPDSEGRIEFLNSYVEVYLREEIVAEQIVRKIPPFRRFLDISAQMNAQIINYSQIAREVGVTPDTIKQYFSIMEETHLGVILPSYHRSIRKQQSQAPKFYYFDCGVPRAILRTNAAPLNERTSLYGSIFEQFIVLEIIRINSYLRKRAHLSYLRSKDGAEIDLIIEFPNEKTVLLEIKSSQNVSPEMLRSLINYKKSFENALAFCLSRDPIPREVAGVKLRPWQEGIEEIFSTTQND